MTVTTSISSSITPSLSDDISRSVINNIFGREGGYVDIPDDKGGPTNWGITLTAYNEWAGGNADKEYLKLLPRELAVKFYTEVHIKPLLGIVDYSLLDLAVDTSVLNGRSRCYHWLQRAAGVVEDGNLGPISFARINNIPRYIYYKLCSVRLKAYAAIVSQKLSQVIFIAGWTNRTCEFIEKGWKGENRI